MVASSSGDSSGTSSSGDSDDGVDMALRESLGGVLQQLRLETQAAHAIVELATMVEAPAAAVEYISKRVRQTKSMPLVVGCLSRQDTALCALHVLGKLAAAEEIGPEGTRSRELIRELRGFEQVLPFLWASADPFLLTETLLVLRHFCTYPEQQKLMKERGAIDRLKQLSEGGSLQLQALARECQSALSNKKGGRVWGGGRQKPPAPQHGAASIHPPQVMRQQRQPQQQQQRRPEVAAAPVRLKFTVNTGGAASEEQMREYFGDRRNGLEPATRVTYVCDGERPRRGAAYA